MSQLEKYGLYVLVVVIFLILGVSIWGDEPVNREELSQVDTSRLQSQPEAGDPRLRAPGDLEQLGTVGSFLTPQELQAARGAGQRSSGRDARTGTEAAGNQRGAASAAELLGASRNDEPSVGGGEVVPPAPDRAGQIIRHTMVSGETFSGLALRYYGNANLWRAIVDANPTVDPDRVRDGTVVNVPPRTEVAAAGGGERRGASGASRGGDAGDRRMHELQKGETFSSLSKRYYGTPNHFQRIADANPDLDPRRLQLGVMVHVPRVTSQAGSQD